MSRKFALLALAPCILLAPGCDLEELGGARYTKDFHYSYPLEAGGKLAVETFNGGVEIMGWDQQTVEIDGAKYGPTPEAADDIRIEIANTPASIEIRALRPANFRGNRGARFSLKAPRNAVVERVASSNGSIVIQGASGPARLHTSNGSIRVENFEQGVDAHTTNASIELRDINGDVAAATTNGRVRAEGIKGSLDVHSTNGSLTAVIAGGNSSRSARLETTNAGVDLTVPAGWENDARVNTSNGQIVLRMPAGINAHVIARTNNAGISSDFAMEVHGVASKSRLDATLGRGGPLIDLSTSNAAIRLLRL